MTRSPGPERPRAARPPGRKDPYGLLPGGTPLAAILSIVGLVVIAIVTLSLVNGSLPFGVGGTGNGNAGPGANRRPQGPADADAVERRGRSHRGARAGGPRHPRLRQGRQHLAPGGRRGDAAHGRRQRLDAVVLRGRVRRVLRADPRAWRARGCVDGQTRKYKMDVPSIMRIPTAGGKATTVLDGLVDPPGKLKWMGFIQGPVVSPDGATIAMTSDLPDPSRSDVTLKLYNLNVAEDQQPRPGPGGAAGPPGPGVATRRQAPRLRAERPRRRQGCAPDLRLQRRTRRRLARSRVRATSTRRSRRTASTWPRRGRARSGRTW